VRFALFLTFNVEKLSKEASDRARSIDSIGISESAL
jgi:hypothetical protein